MPGRARYDRGGAPWASSGGRGSITHRSAAIPESHCRRVARGVNGCRYDGPVAKLERRHQISTPAPLEWEYAPAPGRRATSSASRSATGSSSAASSSTRARRDFPTISPSSEEQLAEVGQAGARGRRRGRRGRPRRLPGRPWPGVVPRERAKYLFRIARIIQERSRELAVLESLDGGKPIRESRDVDLRSRSRTSSTTPVGRTSSEYAFPNF